MIVETNYFTVSLFTIVLKLILKHLYYMNFEVTAVTESGGL